MNSWSSTLKQHSENSCKSTDLDPNRFYIAEEMQVLNIQGLVFMYAHNVGNQYVIPLT